MLLKCRMDGEGSTPTATMALQFDPSLHAYNSQFHSIGIYHCVKTFNQVLFMELFDMKKLFNSVDKAKRARASVPII